MPRLKSVEDIEIFPLGTKFLVFEDNELVAEIEVEKAWNAKRRREEYKVVFEDYTTVPPARRRAWCASAASAEEKVRRLLEEEFSDAEVWFAYCPWEERVALWGKLLEVEKRAVKGGACISEVRARVEVEVCASLQPDGSALIEVTEDPAALASAIERLLDNPGMAREMGLRARQRVEELYRWDKIVRYMRHVYGRVLEEYSASGWRTLFDSLP